MSEQPEFNLPEQSAPQDVQNEQKTWDLEDSLHADHIMPWGIHKGKKLCDVPFSYIVWMLGQEWILEDRHSYFRKKLITFITSPAAMQILLPIVNAGVRRSGSLDGRVPPTYGKKGLQGEQESDYTQLSDDEIEDVSF